MFRSTTLAMAFFFLAIGNMTRGQDPNTIETYKNLLNQGIGDYRGAAPKAIEWLKAKDDAVVIKSAELLAVIGSKLKDSDEDDDKKLRLKAGKALIKTARTAERKEISKKEVAKAATSAVEKFTTKKEREALLEQIKKEEEEKDK